MLLSFVVPCYNEAGNVSRFFREVSGAFAERYEQLEFVFIDDGSSDTTLQELKELYATQTDVQMQVLSFSRNFGKEAAMYAGLSNAKGDFVCIIDADLQQSPEVVIQMLEELYADEALDCVAAFQEKRRENAVLSKVKGAFYKIINKISEVDFVSGASDFRLMRRGMVDALVSMTEYHRFSKGLFSWVGFHTKYIPYTARERADGKSKWGTRKLIKYALDGIFAFSNAPLRIATYIGMFSAFLSVLFFLEMLIEKIFFGIDVKGYPTIVALILFIGGVQLFCFGILGEYIARMYVQVKNRPIYIVKQHLKKEKLLDRFPITDDEK